MNLNILPFCFSICLSLTSYILVSSEFHEDYDCCMNIPIWQVSIEKILLNFFNAGRFVIIFNGHGLFQITAVSPKLNEMVVIERIRMTENPATRSCLLDAMNNFLVRIGVNMEKVDFVLDAYGNVPMNKIGTTKQPILSTGSRHLKKMLLLLFENMYVIQKKTMLPKYSREAYKEIRERCRVVRATDFAQQCLSRTLCRMNLLSQCDLSQIGGDINKVYTEEDLQIRFPDPDVKTRDGIREQFQNALNCIQLIFALDRNNKADVIKYIEAFLHLICTEEQKECTDPCLQSYCFNCFR